MSATFTPYIVEMEYRLCPFSTVCRKNVRFSCAKAMARDDSNANDKANMRCDNFIRFFGVLHSGPFPGTGRFVMSDKGTN